MDRIPVKEAPLAARAAALSSLLPEDVVMVRRTAAWIWGLDVLPPGVDEADWEIELVMAAGPGNPSETPASAGTIETAPITSESSGTASGASSDFLRRPAPYLEALLTAMLQRGWTPDDAAMERLALHLARLARRR